MRRDQLVPQAMSHRGFCHSSNKKFQTSNSTVLYFLGLILTHSSSQIITTPSSPFGLWISFFEFLKQELESHSSSFGDHQVSQGSRLPPAKITKSQERLHHAPKHPAFVKVSTGIPASSVCTLAPGMYIWGRKEGSLESQVGSSDSPCPLHKECY